MGTLSDIERTEWDWEFIQLCMNRVFMGAFRYGSIRENQHAIYRPDEMRRRIRLYESTGNKEYLCDIANMALLEFKYPAVDGAHFESVDDGQHCKRSGE
jgi:hypothetical protein